MCLSFIEKKKNCSLDYTLFSSKLEISQTFEKSDSKFSKDLTKDGRNISDTRSLSCPAKRQQALKSDPPAFMGLDILDRVSILSVEKITQGLSITAKTFCWTFLIIFFYSRCLPWYDWSGWSWSASLGGRFKPRN